MGSKTAAIVGANVGAETDEHEYKSLIVTEGMSKKKKTSAADKSKEPPQKILDPCKPPSADKSKKPPPIVRLCKDTSEVLDKVVEHRKEINAMLNHHTRGTVHFGIDKSNMVEEGLDLEPQVDVVDKLQTRIGQLLQEFYPPVQTRFVRIERVQLLKSTGEPMGRWRFDICVTPYDKDVVHLCDKGNVAYYRQGGNSMPMSASMIKTLREERQAKRNHP